MNPKEERNIKEKRYTGDEIREIRDYDRDNMLYADRCMLKWQGMLLSEHSESLQSSSNLTISKSQDKTSRGKLSSR